MNRIDWNKPINKILAILLGIAILCLSVFLHFVCRYQVACRQLERNEYLKAYDNFTALGTYKDSSELIAQCGIKAIDFNYDDALMIFESDKDRFSKEIIYVNGLKSLKEGMYDKAIENFKQCEGVLDYESNLNNSYYLNGKKLLDQKDYSNALSNLLNVEEYQDAKELITQANYGYGVELFNKCELEDSLTYLNKTNGYLNSVDYINQASYSLGQTSFENKEYKRAIDYLQNIKDYKDSNEYYIKASYAYGMEIYSLENFEEAKKYLEECDDYKDSKKYAVNAGYLIEYKDKFTQAESDYQKGNLNKAKEAFESLPSSMFYNGVTVSKRLKTLKKYNAFVKMCGSWRTYKAKRKAYCIGYYNTWWYYGDDSASCEIRCIILGNGKVKLEGSAYVGIYTDYYGPKGGTASTTINKTVKKVPSSLSIGGRIKLSYKGGKIKLSYAKSSYDGYFRYKYTTKATLSKSKDY